MLTLCVLRKFFRRWEKKFPENAEGKRSLVIPALWIGQRQNGFISKEVVHYVAELTGTEPLHVWGVATFYTMFLKEKSGKNIIHFCTNITCTLMGSEELMLSTCKKLGISPGETTSDGLVTVLEAECLGACGESPTVQVNHTQYMVKVTENDIEKLIQTLKTGSR